MSALAQVYSRALDAFDRGDWRRAAELALQVARQVPGHAEAHFIAGVAALQLHDLQMARTALQRAMQCDPVQADYAAQYARCLVLSGLMPEAIAVADSAMLMKCSEASTYDALGVVYSKANIHKPAAEAFARAVRLSPGNANYRFNLATSLMYYGDMEGAEREFETCIAIDPSYWRGYLAISQMRRQTSESNHVPRLGRLLAQSSHHDAQLHLHLALAKEFEDIGDFPQAFQHYVQGKSAYGRLMGSSAVADDAVFDAIEQYFDSAAVGSTGYDTNEPIFVMGMPRSGTTLVDRILSSHSRVQSAGELGHFAAELQRAGTRVPKSLQDSIASLDRSFNGWRDVGMAYVESTRPVTGHAPHFVDKLPHNFLYAGFIARALPNARLICVRRDPMDTCLSNFRQLFAPESAYHRYSFDLMDTGRYFLRFNRLMARWQDWFPGRILEVSYERLVESQEAVTREILEHCGLPWEDTCMSFQDNDAPVPTASAVQVRSGMNRSSLARWKRYETELAPLRRLLESGGISIE